MNGHSFRPGVGVAASSILCVAAIVGCTADDGGGIVDPFAAQPDVSEGLVLVSDDLSELLEHGALEGACERWSAAPDDRRAMLQCGKWMFFYESFEAPGVPRALVETVLRELPEEVGPSFERYGMFGNPTRDDGLPLGLAPAAPIRDAPTVTFTCASCHLGRMPDGRFAIGAPNHEYQYGKHILALVLTPLVAITQRPDQHDPDAIAAIQPLLDRIESDPTIRDRLLSDLAPLVGSGAMVTLSPEMERHYATWRGSNQDFLMAPVPLDDGIHTISKVPTIWGIPNEDEIRRAGMPDAMLAWTGGATSVGRFLDGFVVLFQGVHERWDHERLRPLEELVMALRPPAPTVAQDAERVETGRRLFADAGCTGCHDGPRGGGRRLFDYEEIGTDDVMRRWMDPDGDGQPCCGIDSEGLDPLTGRLKSPRLAGLHASRLFLHNGSVESLEDLFCLDGHERPTITEPAYGDGGHRFTCDGLSDDDKHALIAFLRSI
ncbi:MAG: c-type cytochrome [Deltaproteobacteria bacterium]|nr:c-type cytochrome [Deltaproteobacteria bacterium]